MLTEQDRKDEAERSDPQKKYSKRERRRDYARRVAERQCEGCRHANGDHVPMRHSRDRFCHVCTEVCATT